MKDVNDLLDCFKLFLPLLESHQEFELSKLARTSILKLSGLSQTIESVGFLTEEQNVILDICNKDYEYISQRVNQLKFETKRTLH